MKLPAFLAGCLFLTAPAWLPAAVASDEPVAVAQPIEVRLAESHLTTLRFLESGQPVAVGAFTTRDVPAFVTTFTWDNPAMGGGFHTVTWNWYNKGVLVSTSSHRNVEFKSSPHLLKTSRSSDIIGTGPIRIEVLIDGKVLASAGFEIKNGLTHNSSAPQK
jgi:hypothetical protein